ncbi:MAG: TauD/TfdA family dioxygenase [Acidobacteria bacterium]|nr:TauD/TfdA family dioxygenase [Acidobacteriota bacterium]
MDGGRADEHGFLVYSTTGRAFPCHTDLYRDRHPADLLLMKCVRADRGGGRTIIYKLRDLLASLSPREISVLRRPSFPTEFGKIQLLSADSHGYSIRYNRREIDFFARLRREPLSARQSEVLNKIDLLLANGKERQEFLLQPGQCIVINNKTVLHGRTRLSKGTKRLLKRIRLPARPRLRGLNLVAN